MRDMRLGSKTNDEFLIKLNEKNNQIQRIFHEKIKEIAKKIPSGCYDAGWYCKKTRNF